MPTMGVPDFVKKKNPFKGITKASPQKSREEIIKSLSKGDKDNFFVDRTKHNKMNKDSFLKLLSHQLQNQDPMNPMDQNKFAADLAQFAQLEQMANMNTKMGQLGANAPAEAKSMMANFLGKRIFTRVQKIDFAGKPVSINFDLPEGGQKAIVRVQDKQGQTVAEINSDQIQKGTNFVSWDGNRLDGYPARQGEYTIDVKYLSQTGEMKSAPGGTHGIIQSVAFVNGNPVFTLDNGKQVSLKEAYKFEMPKQMNKSQASAKQVASQYQQNQKGMGQ